MPSWRLSAWEWHVGNSSTNEFAGTEIWNKGSFHRSSIAAFQMAHGDLDEDSSGGSARWTSF